VATRGTLVVNINTDCTVLLRRTKHYDKRLAYNVVAAINESALAVQAAERVNVRKKLHVRIGPFIDRMIAVVKPKASVLGKRAFAEVAIGQKERLILALTETGGRKDPKVGKNVAIPYRTGPARRTLEESVPKALYMTALKFKKAKKGSALIGKRVGGGKSKGAAADTGFYIIPDVGVFLRTRKGQKSQLVYAFKERWKVPKALGWLLLAKKVAERSVQLALFREVSKTLRREGLV